MKKKSWYERALKKSSYSSNGCLEFNGFNTIKGYGSIKNNGKMQYVHRLSYERANGEIPKGLIVRHKCDNPCCWDPDHLELGTHQNNMDDMTSRGRSNDQKGVLNHNNKLTYNQVIEIKELLQTTDITQKEIGKMFNISQPHVSSIKLDKNWKSLEEKS